MIHIIDNHSGPESQSLLRSMFADRKRLFVDLFGWDVPVIDGKYEMDQFDNDHTLYLIADDEDGGHAASIRLFPSSQPHMLGTLFPHLCPLGVPVDDATWESTRLCLPQRHGAERRRELRNWLFSAMVDIALKRGIERYTGVIPDPFRKEVLPLFCMVLLPGAGPPQPLGPAVRVQGGSIGAFLIHVRPDTPERLRWTGVYSPVLDGASA
jgi:acyl-homoserine lactone synthase